jgi:flagellar biosynthesis/type III secretory pathway chaperone
MTPTANTQIEQLVRVASQLIDIMNREVEMLRAMRVSDIGALQQEKQNLTIQYEDAIAALAAEPDVLQAMEPALRSELAAVATRFDAAVDENARALHAVKVSHDRLLRAIVDAVSEQRSRQRAYTAKGALDNQRTGRRTPPISLTVDQRL